MKKKQVSMIRKYHNHKLQTNPRHCDQEPQNTNSRKTPERKIKAKQPALSSSSKWLQN